MQPQSVMPGDQFYTNIAQGKSLKAALLLSAAKSKQYNV
jgi:hypothetical protein